MPTIIKEKITTGLAGLTSGKVTLGNVRFNLFRGVVISDLELFDQKDPSIKLCSIKDASAGFLFIGFIKEKKIIIPSLNLNSLEFYFVRQKDGSFNITYLVDKLKNPSAPGNMPAIIIKAVKISDSAIHFTDLATQLPVIANLNIGRMSLNMSWQKAIAEAMISITTDNKITDFGIKASYAYSTQAWKADIIAETVDVLVFKEYLKNLPVTLDSAQLTGLKIDSSFENGILNANTTFGFNSLGLRQNDLVIKDAKGSTTFSAGYSKSENKLDLSLDLDTFGVNAQKNGIKLTNASLQTNAKMTIPLVKKDDAPIALTYAGTAVASADEISGAGQIGTISGASAKLQFKNNEVIIQELLAKALDADISAKGDLKENILNLDIEGDFDLEQISKVLPQDLGLPAFEISGTTETKTHLTFDTTKQQAPMFKGEATLQNVSFQLPQDKIALETDVGRIKFDTSQESLQWHFETVKYLDRAYSLDGNLKNFKTPQINALIIGQDARLKIDFIKEQDLIKISSAKGSYKNSGFDITGSLDAEVSLNASGTVDLDLEDLKYILPQDKIALQQINPKGKCMVRADIAGPLKDYSSWRINAKGKSDWISCYGLKFQNIVLDYTQVQNQGFLNLLQFDAYRGKGAIKGKLEFLGQDIGYALRGILNDIDLGIMKADTPLKDKDFYGLLDLNISVKGRDTDLNTIAGGGSFAIKDGNIWEFNPLEGLGNFIFSPGFNKVAFTNAQADFTIQDSYVATDNLELIGPEFGLMVEGKVSFNGELDLLLNTQLPIKGQRKVGDTISKAGSLSAIKVTGTAKDPKYKLQAVGENIMKKLGEIFSNITP
jgi:hypothetical protein